MIEKLYDIEYLKNTLYQRNKKMGLSTYPYVNTRVRVMKGSMIKKDDYKRLLKMSRDEIVKYLSDIGYKKEIDELAAKYDGLDLVEAALNTNAARVFAKLIRISDREVEIVVREYLRRYDVYNLKTIIRGRATGMSNDKIRRLFIPAGYLSEEKLLELMKKETIEEIISESGVIEINDEITDAIEEYEKTNSLAELENLIDKDYYYRILDFSKTIPKEGKFIEDFIKAEIDFLNLRTIFRMVREQADKEKIVEMLIYSGEKLDDARLAKLAGAKDYDDIVEMLKGTGYDKIITGFLKDIKENNEFGSLEIAAEKKWLNKAYRMLHEHPMSIGPIYGFMVGKDIEIRNLRMLVRAKAAGLDEKFMNESLVV